jgi:hypothetical protein
MPPSNSIPAKFRSVRHKNPQCSASKPPISRQSDSLCSNDRIQEPLTHKSTQPFAQPNSCDCDSPLTPVTAFHRISSVVSGKFDFATTFNFSTIFSFYTLPFPFHKRALKAIRFYTCSTRLVTSILRLCCSASALAII